MKIITVELWVADEHTIETGHGGRIAPDVLGIMAAQYDAHVLTDEEITKRADGIGQRAHYQTVQDIVSSLVDAIKSGEVEDEDAAQDWLHQTVDGHHDVIYTACAKDVLRYSDHEDALADEYGNESLVQDGAINWSGMAYAALLADVQAEIGDISKYFNCRDCSYPVPRGMGETDWTRDEDGLPVCKDCAENKDEDDSRTAESI